MSDPITPPNGRSARRLAALVAGPILYAVLFTIAPASLSIAAAHVLGIAGWMAFWWLTEPIPIGITALLPLALFPLLGVSTTRDAAAPYANDLVFLFLAGFLLAAALEYWNAHARIAYGIVGTIGTSGRRVVLGVMLATGFISMWISNTAAAAMVYPIALAISDLFKDDSSHSPFQPSAMSGSSDVRNLRTALMLGVAYAASIGGMGTLIGTPPNLIFAAAAKQLTGREVSFVEFMTIGTPIVIVLLPLSWAMLVYVLFPTKLALGAEARRIFAERRASVGHLRGGEAITLTVFALTAIAWFMRERKEMGGITIPGLADIAPAISDASIGVTGALLLFVLSGRARDGTRRPLLTWREARDIPWEILLLFGGGLSLAAAMEATGLAQWIGSLMSGLNGFPNLIIYSGLALLVLALSEIASNTAVATMVMPIAVSYTHLTLPTTPYV